MTKKHGALAGLDLTLRLTRTEETERLAVAQDRLLQLRLLLGGVTGKDPKIGAPGCVVFGGWDVSGQGARERAAGVCGLRGLGRLRQGRGDQAAGGAAGPAARPGGVVRGAEL